MPWYRRIIVLIHVNAEISFFTTDAWDSPVIPGSCGVPNYGRFPSYHSFSELFVATETPVRVLSRTLFHDMYIVTFCLKFFFCMG
jgi:hypothetical protein